MGNFFTNQVPAKGDYVTLFPDTPNNGGGFDGWGHWIVDVVSWKIAHRASMTAIQVAKESQGDMGSAYCEAVELHVWPSEGPYWSKTPRFAKVLAPDWYEDTAPEDEADE